MNVLAQSLLPLLITFKLTSCFTSNWTCAIKRVIITRPWFAFRVSTHYILYTSCHHPSSPTHSKFPASSIATKLVHVNQDIQFHQTWQRILASQVLGFQPFSPPIFVHNIERVLCINSCQLPVISNYYAAALYDSVGWSFFPVSVKLHRKPIIS